VLDDPTVLATAANHHAVTAPRAGIVTKADARDLGVGAMRLGAGRATKEAVIDPGVGSTIEVSVGDRVAEGDVLATLHYNDDTHLGNAIELTERAFEVEDGPATIPPLVYEEVR
jgi:pyrimidine-nucleoside phosphorylase